VQSSRSQTGVSSNLTRSASLHSQETGFELSGQRAVRAVLAHSSRSAQTLLTKLYLREVDEDTDIAADDLRAVVANVLRVLTQPNRLADP
jgi:hypothetical protein